MIDIDPNTDGLPGIEQLRVIVGKVVEIVRPEHDRNIDVRRSRPGLVSDESAVDPEASAGHDPAHDPMPELKCVEDDATPISEGCGGDKAFVDLLERRGVQPLWEVPRPVFEGRDHALLPMRASISSTWA